MTDGERNQKRYLMMLERLAILREDMPHKDRARIFLIVTIAKII